MSTAHARHRRASRIAHVLAVPIAILLSGAMIGTASYAAFSATTSSPTSNWAAGTVAVSSNVALCAGSSHDGTILRASEFSNSSVGSRTLSFPSTEEPSGAPVSEAGRSSGTSVARDFVELPSQLYEHWLGVPELLDRSGTGTRS